MPLLRHDDNLLDALDAPTAAVLARATALAAALGERLWLVGGVVRDLLLDLPVERDFDLAVEGDAVALAHALAAAMGARVAAEHLAFGTATVESEQWLAGGDTSAPAVVACPLALDLATARTETYAHPAALPAVQPARIADDLVRRDFSINAIAVELRVAGGRLRQGEVLDPFAGRRDLAAGVLRVLHDASFDDDPTRLLRGLRLAARLNLRPDGHTAALMRRALDQGRLEATSPDRVRSELCLALAEPDPAEVLRLADAWGLSTHILPGLRYMPGIASATARVRDDTLHGATVGADEARLIYAGLLSYDLSHKQRLALSSRYRLPHAYAHLLRELGAAQQAVAGLAADLAASELDRRLQPFGATTLLVCYYAELAPRRELVQRYLSELRPVTTLLDGYGLQRLGVAPGPRLGQLLRQLRAARLDGIVASMADEEAWVRARMGDA